MATDTTGPWPVWLHQLDYGLMHQKVAGLIHGWLGCKYPQSACSQGTSGRQRRAASLTGVSLALPLPRPNFLPLHKHLKLRSFTTLLSGSQLFLFSVERPQSKVSLPFSPPLRLPSLSLWMRGQ